ncbi:uncharacterized protein LOC128550622 [Mercenaria mercenaria]|uniref:uncharacterized protein LOC128550622 n=1 Tax=Mercenaria mercenaria TaxID=6596 RepID=UPI00234ED7DC|nr:uncharacterized protein LOC128550622 [Mercenaria mercenaria]
MGNCARECLNCILWLKLIIMGVLKIVCLSKGILHSNWHSVLTFYSLLFEVVAISVSRKPKDSDKGPAVVFHACASSFKVSATLVTYSNEIEDMKSMCYWCLITEIVLIGVIFCCYCCTDEPRHNSSKLKLAA